MNVSKIILFIIITGAIAMPAIADNLEIGWASRDVTPREAIAIPGQFHLRISKGVLDPITLTALVIDNGEDSVIFLSADIVSIRSFLLDKIREKTAKLNPDIPVLKILMNATHTHTGPVDETVRILKEIYP